MKYLKTYESMARGYDREPKFKKGDWVVASNVSNWYEGIWNNLLDFLRTTPGQITASFDLGGISYNVVYFNTSKEKEFNEAYYNDNPGAYVGIDRDFFKIYEKGEYELRLATDEEIESEENKISLEIDTNKYNL